MTADPNKPDAKPRGGGAHFGRYILIGFFTIAPLWVTWLVFDFLLGLLVGAGRPLLHAAARAVAPLSPQLAEWLHDSSLQQVVAVLLTLAALYGVGVLASLVLGRRLIEWMERLLNRLPLVQTIYGGTKRMLHSLRTAPAGGQRVVLIHFPTPGMKSVGLVTRTITDRDSGRELAVVYVPTSPNPTSGYIEIVPIEDVVPTDWSVEEAMSFVMTAGATSPDSVRFERDRAPG